MSFDPRFFDVPAKMLSDEGLPLIEVPQIGRADDGRLRDRSSNSSSGARSATTATRPSRPTSSTPCPASTSAASPSRSPSPAAGSTAASPSPSPSTGRSAAEPEESTRSSHGPDRPRQLPRPRQSSSAPPMTGFDNFWPWANLVGGSATRSGLKPRMPGRAAGGDPGRLRGAAWPGAYKANGVVFAVDADPDALFSQARFQYQALRNGTARRPVRRRRRSTSSSTRGRAPRPATS